MPASLGRINHVTKSNKTDGKKGTKRAPSSSVRRRRERRLPPIVIPEWALLFSIVLAVSGILLFFMLPVPSISEGETALIADLRGSEELVHDSSALRALREAGVSGVMLAPPSLSALKSRGDIALATGEEILRLFRMESILNIWMWEALRDKGIDPESVYVFADRLEVFESIYEAALKKWGEQSVRPYRDRSHDFSGDIPGNYILVVEKSLEEVLRLEPLVSDGYLEAIPTYGFSPVYYLNHTSDIFSVPPRSLVYSDQPDVIAEIRKRGAGLILLAPSHIDAPSGLQTVTARRTADPISVSMRDKVLIVDPSDASAVSRNILREGMSISKGISLAQETDVKWNIRKVSYFVYASIVTGFFLYLVWPRRVDGSLYTDLTWAAIVLISFCFALFQSEETLVGAVVTVALIFGTVLMARSRNSVPPPVQGLVWGLLGLCVLTSAGRELFVADGAVIGPAAALLFLIAYNVRIELLKLLMAGAAFAALGIWPTALPFAALMLVVVIAAMFLENEATATALLLLFVPTALLALLDGGIALFVRILLVIAVSVVAALAAANSDRSNRTRKSAARS